MFEKCPNCLKRVVRGSKYCTHCGEKMPLVAKQKKQKRKKDFINVDFGESKRIFNRYKNYFVERIKDPTVSMKKSMQKESFQFGVVQLIVIALINVLTVLTLYGKLNIGNSFSIDVSRLSIFAGSIILQASLLLSTVVSLYFATNYLKKVPTTFKTIVSRVGGFASLQLLVSVVLLIAVFLEIRTLYSIGLYLFVLISIGLINFYLLRIKNSSTIPSLYTTIFTMGMFLALQIITYTFIQMFSANPHIYPKIIGLLIG